MVAGPPSDAREAVVVTGLGLATSLGFGVETNWARLLAGESAIAVRSPGSFPLPIPMPELPVAAVEREALAARIREAVPRSVWNTSEEVCHLWLLAALEALAQAGLDGERGGATHPTPERVGVYAGTGAGAAPFIEQAFVNIFTAERAVNRDVSRMGVPKYMASSLASQLSILKGFRGPALTLNTACASGASALLTALDALRLGRIDCAVAGGVDITVVGSVLKAFYKLGALSARGAGRSRPFEQGRDGIVLGDGAAALVLERASAAAARGAPALARLLGGAQASEAHHLLSPREEGEGMAATMAPALADAGLEPERVAHVYTHGTGTRYNDACEAAALARVLPHRPTLSATKALLGHTLGAAGAIDAVLATRSLRTGHVVPLAALGQLDPACDVNPAREAEQPGLQEADAAVMVNAFAFGGHNATLLFGPPSAAREPSP
jgi:3-oxoacyl-[acyl-carrier-protein] synthase II